MHVGTLTFTDVVKGPLVVLEEGMTLNFINSSAAQTNLPAHSDKRQRAARLRAESPRCECKTHPTPPLHPPSLTCHPKHTAQWNDCSALTILTSMESCMTTGLENLLCSVRPEII